MITVSELDKSYGDRAILKGVSLSVAKQEVLAVIGPSGSGKTTLLRILDMLVRPTSGTVLFDGIDTSLSERVRRDVRRRMAMVFQKPAAFSGSVYDNVAYGLKIRGVRGREARKNVLNALDTVGLAGYEDRKAKTLSGGEVQRVALARAMVIEPELLLLDEPTANLDVVSTRKVEHLLERVIRELNTTVILSTHDLAQGRRLANRIGVLMDGELLQVGTPQDIFSRPASPEVAEFVSAANDLAARGNGYDVTSPA